MYIAFNLSYLISIYQKDVDQNIYFFLKGPLVYQRLHYSFYIIIIIVMHGSVHAHFLLFVYTTQQIVDQSRFVEILLTF